MASKTTSVQRKRKGSPTLRAESTRIRRAFTDQVKAVAEEKPAYWHLTDVGYLGVFGENASGLRRQRGLSKKANVRDHLTDPERAAVMCVEAMARERIERGLATTSDGIGLIVFRCGLQMRPVLEKHREVLDPAKNPPPANDERRQEDAA